VTISETTKFTVSRKTSQPVRYAPHHFPTAASAALTLRYLDGGHGDGCNEADDRFTLWRRRMHHLTFYGFILCFAATCVATVYHYGLGRISPYAWWDLPPLLGTRREFKQHGQSGMWVSNLFPHTATIVDDATEPSQNPLDDPRQFVIQHYHDFLNREPDQSGLDFWTNQIASCGNDVQCNEVRRIDVSASFFLSIEFQQSGYLVERCYKVAYGDVTGTSNFPSNHQLSVPTVRFDEFLKDTQRIGQGVIVLQPGWEQALEGNKQAYALEFVQTTRFNTAFATTMTPAQFVDQLNLNAGSVLSPIERTTAINLFAGAANSGNASARAQAVRMVAEDTDLYNAEYNRAFVLAEYFGYLRRNPNDTPDTDFTGYDFWLTKLNQFNGNYINAEMVKAFLSSIEYRQRFGP